MNTFDMSDSGLQPLRRNLDKVRVRLKGWSGRTEVESGGAGRDRWWVQELSAPAQAEKVL
jgi:hypothetical protein